MDADFTRLSRYTCVWWMEIHALSLLRKAEVSPCQGDTMRHLPEIAKDTGAAQYRVESLPQFRCVASSLPREKICMGQSDRLTQPTHKGVLHMTVLTNHEQQEIDRANTQGKQPVVFVHGLWLLSSSWDRWRALFEEQGYTTLAPGWPHDPQTVKERKADPEVLPNKRLRQAHHHSMATIRQ